MWWSPTHLRSYSCGTQRQQTRQEGGPQPAPSTRRRTTPWVGHLELMMDRDLSACVSQESVRASTSALSCSQASLLAGPSRPENGPESDFVLLSQTGANRLVHSLHVVTLPSGWLTPHIVFVRAIQFFDSSVAEGQFPHPVDPAADTRGQAQVGASCSCMEAISCKTVSTVDNNDMFYLKNLL